MEDCRSCFEHIGHTEWLYEQFRTYMFSELVDDLIARDKDLRRNPSEELQWRRWEFSSFERELPVRRHDFLERHATYTHWWWLVDYLNYLMFLSGPRPLGGSQLAAVWNETGPHLRNHLSEGDLSKLAAVHARLVDRLDQWWSLEIGLRNSTSH